ncbi:hypothetical protein [Kitasatospora acidiphila]|uniref:hypothetical protein n=1 Tax=Kitasatospora acidiphila TaxID=2567942 RepID=UPI0015F093A7|nr:hypothetical protein [Kitasatospora acidiphila]
MAVSPTVAPIDRLRRAVARTAELVADREATGLSHDDADDEHGTVGTDGAIGFDPVPLLAELDRQGAPVVAIGQVAGILHGSRELTGDLDLLWDGDPSRADAMAAAFAAVGAVLLDEDGNELPCTPRRSTSASSTSAPRRPPATCARPSSPGASSTWRTS